MKPCQHCGVSNSIEGSEVLSAAVEKEGHLSRRSGNETEGSLEQSGGAAGNETEGALEQRATSVEQEIALEQRTTGTEFEGQLEPPGTEFEGQLEPPKAR